MQLAKSIVLSRSEIGLKIITTVLSLASVAVVSGQSNSPYSRYGLGDASPTSNITTRGMGSFSAGYADYVSVNFNNPASYASYFALKETKTSKLQYGRIVFDAGLNFGSRTLRQPNTTQSFTSSDAFFSYLQIGIPLRRNWGLSLGLRPLTRIGYKVNRFEKLTDPISGEPVDSALTEFNGNGGSFLPSIGTGFAIGNFSVGANMGYLFGNKELDTRRTLLGNDTVNYYASRHSDNYSFGSLFFNAGLQYVLYLDSPNRKFIRFGLSGNWKQTLKGSQDILRQTFALGSAGIVIPIDSVFAKNGVSGEVTYPASYTAGFVYTDYQVNGRGFLFGADYTQAKWSDYLFFGQKDSVQDSWKIQTGGQINPKPGTGYFSRVAYRFGFTVGKDYIKVQKDLPIWGASFGMALPIRASRLAPNQYNAVNLSFEFLKRGNNENLLKENAFRLSLGLNFTDLWFVKRKYE